MRIILDVNSKYDEDEVIIKCKNLNSKIRAIEDAIRNVEGKDNSMVFYKNDKEYYLSLEEILFFETDQTGIMAHTRDDIYKVNYKLYELEKILSLDFIRVSKSSILNVKHIFAITKNITASSKVEFKNSNKTVYVSRMYYNLLCDRLSERR